MVADWSTLCQVKDFRVNDSQIYVQFLNGRRQKVTIEENDETYFLSSVVARRLVVSSLTNLPIDAWLRNRATALVGFRIDRKGRLVGESWLPKVEVTAEEFQLYVRTIATECDRFEFILTGRDIE